MIRRIWSSLDTFKELTFRDGLNILIADTSPDATERQTRNGAGKSSLTEIIHFLLGANCDKDSLFRAEPLVDSYFGMTFDLHNSVTSIERIGKKPSEVHVDTANHQLWVNDIDITFNQFVSSNTDWKSLLGHLIFDIPLNGTAVDKYGPSFRSLISYFVRRQNSGAFMKPEKHATMQQLWDIQVSISYLLGLDWTVPHEWQMIRQREKALKELRKLAEDGDLGDVFGTVADLRTKLTLAEDRRRRFRESIDSFNVLPEYRDLEIEASELTTQLSMLSNDNTVDRELMAELNRSIESERIPPLDSFERLYEEAGVVLPGTILRRIEDARTFHESVINNRRSYLSSEIEAAKERLFKRDQEMNLLSERRAQIMKVLSSHGALVHFTELQSRLSAMEAETELLKQRFVAAEELEGTKNELEIERRKLLFRLQQDYQEQSILLSDAIVTFQEISNDLYENAGSLTIADTSNGPQFEVRIQGGKSKGINNMQIFCFDMMLMKLCSKRGIGPGFLVHDSHLFDGVDGRQIATALTIGANLAKKFNFQYIVMMNSDDLPNQFPDEFHVQDYVLPVRLTDETETGGLFGIRF